MSRSLSAAPWCGPCRMLAPIFEKLSEDYEGKVTFVKCNVDNNPETAIKHGIQGIPTIIFFENGQPVEMKVGVKLENEFKETIEKLL